MILRSKKRTPFLLALGLTIATAVLPSCNSNPGPDSISSHGAAQPGALPLDCGLCHSIALGSRRAVMGLNGDFGRNAGRASHHVVAGSSDPTPSQCLTCHNLDQHGSGTVQLNNADTGAVIPYTSSANMETFCMSCHDTDGASTNMSPFSDGRTLGATYPVDTATRPPTTNEIAAIGWTAPGNAHSDDGLYATANPGQNETIESRWGNFGFDGLLPQRIERGRFNYVYIIGQYHVDTNTSIARLNAQATVSGIDCPSVPQYHAAEPTLDYTFTFDVTSCRNWTVNDLLDANFKVKLGASRENSATPVTFSLDYIRVEVSYNGTSYIASPLIKDAWNKTYGHYRRGLSCIGTGNAGANMGCHANGHGSNSAGILARNMTMPLNEWAWFSVASEPYYELCFNCHQSYSNITKEAILGYRLGGNYDINGDGPPPYNIPDIMTKFRDRYDGSAKPYDNSGWTGGYSNLHYFHVQGGLWKYRDVVPSSIQCIACHNVHGSNTQWGWVHDEMQYNHYDDGLPVPIDRYGRIDAPGASLDNYPTGCGLFNCHDGFMGATTNWFEPPNE